MKRRIAYMKKKETSAQWRHTKHSPSSAWRDMSRTPALKEWTNCDEPSRGGLPRVQISSKMSFYQRKPKQQLYLNGTRLRWESDVTRCSWLSVDWDGRLERGNGLNGKGKGGGGRFLNVKLVFIAGLLRVPRWWNPIVLRWLLLFWRRFPRTCFPWFALQQDEDEDK